MGYSSDRPTGRIAMCVTGPDGLSGSVICAGAAVPVVGLVVVAAAFPPTVAAWAEALLVQAMAGSDPATSSSATVVSRRT